MEKAVKQNKMAYKKGGECSECNDKEATQERIRNESSNNGQEI